ncbi:hypothetical protein Q5Y75_23040 [Ruegeria sp. 2205SS24-7]|uniref:hypothetical protein n=1 Tax=Ruegeria discodermiae TaxID=3064389 RepID=UPI00274249AF|nr:hypothetical protein [Ruegeria sp. 2205SS24-7]MDP5220081.1 hypothetical protein [Ruegeria sp. 2205SS24-7]
MKRILRLSEGLTGISIDDRAICNMLLDMAHRDAGGAEATHSIRIAPDADSLRLKVLRAL